MLMMLSSWCVVVSWWCLGGIWVQFRLSLGSFSVVTWRFFFLVLSPFNVCRSWLYLPDSMFVLVPETLSPHPKGFRVELKNSRVAPGGDETCGFFSFEIPHRKQHNQCAMSMQIL